MTNFYRKNIVGICCAGLFILLVIFYSGCSDPALNLPITSDTSEIVNNELYLKTIHDELNKQWPKNRSINIVCHGHSVPAGYFNTPVVRLFDSYPHLLHRHLQDKYPYAVINVIVSAIGGETSVAGAKRFESDVLSHQPDIVLIDYVLNDRKEGLQDSKKAWIYMIEKAKEHNVKILLLTPTIDVKHIPEKKSKLNEHAEQIRMLSKIHDVGLVDSLTALENELKRGYTNKELLSNGYNHPNRRAHEIVANKIFEWF